MSEDDEQKYTDSWGHVCGLRDCDRYTWRPVNGIFPIYFPYCSAKFSQAAPQHDDSDTPMLTRASHRVWHGGASGWDVGVTRGQSPVEATTATAGRSVNKQTRVRVSRTRVSLLVPLTRRGPNHGGFYLYCSSACLRSDVNVGKGEFHPSCEGVEWPMPPQCQQPGCAGYCVMAQDGNYLNFCANRCHLVRPRCGNQRPRGRVPAFSFLYEENMSRKRLCMANPDRRQPPRSAGQALRRPLFMLILPCCLPCDVTATI